MKKIILLALRKYLHWKWQRRLNKAWKRAERKAKRWYYEDISSSNPWNYFHEELKELKK